ncbi:MAG: carbohydrate ABC transporter permease [Clostridiales bacterium]|jgi:putative aldouronate transport system permease protein|nr:carbohydrate ABC transporter permease [Clostridiales bacterium]MDR2749534.1 carbohydrate ABC transporter permease [Clostridiales bacterium]
MKRITAGTILNYAFISLIGLVTLYPFIYILSTSITPAKALLSGRVLFLPKGFDLSAYRLMLADPRLPRGFVNSLKYTAAGTLLGVIVTVVTAYPLAHPQFERYAKHYMKFVVFTMLFSGGLIPTFLAISNYHLIDSFWVMVLPGLLSPFYLILVRTFMKEIPREMFESVMLEGASHIQALIFVMLPLSAPIIACVTFYYAVAIWNNYMTPLIYLRSDTKFPLQIFLRQIVLQSSMSDQMASAESSSSLSFNTEAIKSATLVISTIPIMIAYPFLQKYFVKGLMVGAIKG